MIKQIYDLTQEDIIRCPIWQFLSEDNEEAEDEATVKEFSENPDSIESIIIVKTKFKINDGTEYLGYVYGDNTGKFGYLQPNIIIGARQFAFWSGIRKPEKKEIKEFYKTLGKNKKEVFPINWEVQFEVSDIIKSGIIEGFKCFSSMKANNIKTIK